MRMIFAICLAALFATPAVSTTFNLDFSGSICNGDMVCGNGSPVDAIYGDIAGQLTVTLDGNASLPGIQPIQHWGSGYETLTNVGYSANSGVGLSILFEPLIGYNVTITSFDIAPYLDRVTNTLVQVIDTATNIAFLDLAIAPLSTSNVTTFSGSWTSTSGILINLGPDAWNVGISNIHGVVGSSTQLPIVPLPAAGWLMLLGLGGLGVLGCRSKIV